ncbi:MAG: recombinase RecT [Chitinophagales bacterium]
MSTYNTTEVAKKELSYSERFAHSVTTAFKENVAKDMQLTKFHQRTMQNYFLKLDLVLKDAEKKRLATNAKYTTQQEEKYKNNLEFSWKNINMSKLALECVPYVLIGLDPMQPNHINLIPFKEADGKSYGIGFIVGYNGIELKARKYGLDVPDDIVVEVIYKNDKFKVIKKDANNKVENYILEPEPFDKGEIIGGFYYKMYYSNPERNVLRTFSLEEIKKRKPPYAAAEFWGGEKDEYKWDKEKNRNVKTGNKIKVEGWEPEMCYKTLKRAGWNSVTIDAEKIDENLQKMQQNERLLLDERVKAEINENANKVPMTFADAETIETVDENKSEQNSEQFAVSVEIVATTEEKKDPNELTQEEKDEIAREEQQQQQDLFNQQKGSQEPGF